MFAETLEAAAAPSTFLVKPARHEWELEQARRLRRAVFCIEQGIFSGDDRDSLDDSAQTLIAATCVAGMPEEIVGTVRIHSGLQRIWWGSRLAVHPAFRNQGHIGSSLIRLAVGLACLEGCDAFYAHVQIQNVPLFERLNWRLLSAVQVHGRPHGLMQADLASYRGSERLRDGIVTRARARP
ncbi:MAG: MSMEG_0567/Sll0786 family nitrogen starvation N-acetyltransferase [Burkholderiaceae bacterium]|jgi:putative N-acetyltransferase (TIGR04045 family)